ncbi:MAG: menaquinone biosynthesis protein [Pirellulaceae bacterium]|nr:menaquinone biosynthesis protein [Pirellulaceae bacterium]
MRIGAVSYLNTKPLVHGLAELAPEHELQFDLPSRLADRLAAAQLDVALIPSIEFFQHPHYEIISDACIGCRGPVRSVKLLSRVPVERIETLALDEGSRTSVALVRILLKQRFGLAPRLVPFPIDAASESIAADALLMIGDRAMHSAAGQFVAEWDLGDVWCRWSELPFVFAMWVARKGSGVRERELGELADLFSQARDGGVANVSQIAREEHARYGLSYDDCLTYLRDHLYFHLGPRELAGLRLYYQHASDLGLAPRGVRLETNPTTSIAGTKPGPGSPRLDASKTKTGRRIAPG